MSKSSCSSRNRASGDLLIYMLQRSWYRHPDQSIQEADRGISCHSISERFRMDSLFAQTPYLKAGMRPNRAMKTKMVKDSTAMATVRKRPIVDAYCNLCHRSRVWQGDRNPRRGCEHDNRWVALAHAHANSSTGLRITRKASPRLSTRSIIVISVYCTRLYLTSLT